MTKKKKRNSVLYGSFLTLSSMLQSTEFSQINCFHDIRCDRPISASSTLHSRDHWIEQKENWNKTEENNSNKITKTFCCQQTGRNSKNCGTLELNCCVDQCACSSSSWTLETEQQRLIKMKESKRKQRAKLKSMSPIIIAAYVHCHQWESTLHETYLLHSLRFKY